MDRKKQHHTDRDRRVQQTMLGGAVLALLLGVLAMLVLLLARQFSAAPANLLRGFGAGLMVVLPIALIGMTYRSYQAMDEYGKGMMLRAFATGFMVVMGLCMAYYPLQEFMHLPAIPLWVIWTVGSTVSGIAMGVQSRDTGPRE